MTQPFVVPAWPRLEVPAGIGPPNKLYWPLQNDVLPSYVTPIDYTTVTAVTFHVTRQYDGSTASWQTSTFQSVTTAGLVAVYAYQVNDVPLLPVPVSQSVYLIRPYLSVTGFPNAIPQQLGYLYIDQL